MSAPKTDAVATTRKAPAALAIPDFADPKDRDGDENPVTAQDIRLPRLALAQGLSPEIQKNDPKKIEGLEAGDIFSNLLQTNYKNGPVEVVIVRREKPRAMEFWPKKGKPNYVEGKKGIKDRSVPLEDPRCKFAEDGTPPIATIFHEYVAFDVETREPFILSFKNTSTGAAKALDTFYSMRKGAWFATTFKVSSALKQFTEAPAYIFNVQPGRAIDKDTYDYALKMREDLKGREVAAPEEEPEAEGGEQKSDEDIPF